MTPKQKQALNRLTRAVPKDSRASVDDLQNLLLQIVFALLMVFVIAYFIFVRNQEKQRTEEIMALNRQKLTLAIEQEAEDRRVRYGLNALMVQGTDGKRTFDPDTYIEGVNLALPPAARTAIATGSQAAYQDYGDAAVLAVDWERRVLDAVSLKREELSEAESQWLSQAIAEKVDVVRLDVRGVQRALAARLLKAQIAHMTVKDEDDAGLLVAQLRREALSLIEKQLQTKLLD